jgi:hypothetical protein
MARVVNPFFGGFMKALSTIGIKETKEALKLILSVGNGVAKSLADDGKLTLADLPNFSASLFLVIPAFTDIALVPDELKDLDESELVEIKDMILAEMPDIGDKWAAVAEHGLNAIYHIYKLILTFKA